MSERDELAMALYSGIGPRHMMPTFGEMADVVLAAGYRKPRTIERDRAVEELDALPFESVVLDVHRDAWTKTDDDDFNGPNGYYETSLSLVLKAPLTVLYEGSAS